VDALVAHYHEIGLKGRNRDFFENALVRNLTRTLRGTGYKRIRRGFGRIVVDFYPEAQIDEALTRASRVFGVAYVGLGLRADQNMKSLTAAALEVLHDATFESFAVRARRTHAHTPISSGEINIAVGQTIKDTTGAGVDLSHPDATVHLELFGGAALVYTRRVLGPGGLPTGVSGKLLALVSGGIDSPIAAWRMMRRGAEVELVHFHGQPYTDPSSVRQVTELAEILTRYQLRTVLHLVPLADAQQDIVTHAPAGLRVVLYRRTMMRIAEALAKERGAGGLVTGDSLGQVASQTLENITTVDDSIIGTQVFRPLIGMDKQEIIDKAIELETYPISTRSYQDCCVLFEPRAPVTRSEPVQARAAEANLDMDAIVGKALAGREERVLEISTAG
jgi:thiamine biosynthesis protein ThiI